MRSNVLAQLRRRIHLRPALTVLRRVLSSPALSPAARTKLVLAVARGAVEVGRGYIAVPMPGGPVFIGRDSPLIDVTTVLDVWEGHMFPADCAGRVVLDIGAHKGYFGAWALARGATAVISCEPHPENHRAIESSRSRNLRRDDWEIERAAVGPSKGRATLYLSRESWGHSLYAHMTDGAGQEEIEVIGLAALIECARACRPGADLVLKLNVEGAAGDMLFAVPPRQFRSISEVHLDHEPNSPHSAEAILRHLADGGLTEVQVHSGRLYRITRAVPSSSGLRPS